MKIKDMGTKELIEMALALYDAIYKFECYSANDMLYLSEILEELERRGVKIKGWVKDETE